MSHEPNPPSPASKPGRFKTFVAWVCGPIVLIELIALAAVGVRAIQVSAKNDSSEPAYVSTTRLMVGGPGVDTVIPDEFYATNIELINSDKVLKRAGARVKALHPGMQAQPCKVEAGRIPRTQIIVIRATGPNPAYVQAYLDAAMDEFIAIRKEMRAGPGEGAMIVIQDELVRMEKDMQLTEEKIEAAKKSGTEPEGLTKLNSKLQQAKMQYERLMVTLRGLDVRPSDRDSLAILDRASGPVLVAQQFSIFNGFK